MSKYRRKIFNEGSFKYFETILGKIRESLPEVRFLTQNHDQPHIQLHLSIPPKIRVSDAVRTIKSISGRMMKKKFSYMRQAYWGRDGIWSDGYFVSTIGINERVIQKYIQQQGLEDMGQAPWSVHLGGLGGLVIFVPSKKVSIKSRCTAG